MTWNPTLEAQTGQLSFPTAPGLGLDLNLDVVKQHPYDPVAYFDTSQAGWEKRIGTQRSPTPPAAAGQP